MEKNPCFSNSILYNVIGFSLSSTLSYALSARERKVALRGYIMMKKIVPLLGALLIGVTIFTSSRYILTIKEKQDILRSLEQIKTKLTQLETEKEKLTRKVDSQKDALNQKDALTRKLESQLQEQQKIIEAKQTIEKTAGISLEKYASIEAELAYAQVRIEELDSAMERLEQENIILVQSQSKLTTQVEQLTEEKTALETRLSSIKELKKAIRELRRKVRKTKARVRPTKKVVKEQKIIEGNRGYLIKDGKSTYSPEVKIIEVIPEVKTEAAPEVKIEVTPAP